MQTVRESKALRKTIASLRADGERLALVPTMGALHAGHMTLVTEAQRRADRVIATIFVNPLQFGANDDLDRYPRQEEVDVARLAEAGCDVLWLPSVGDIYPDGFATNLNVAGVSERWEGEARPGHFDGVATVVAKLLIAMLPDVALFGEKDFQQLAVIRRLVIDLGLDAEIVGVPTVRDDDGLALSSRNAYLSDNERKRAVELPRSLERTRDAISAGEPVAKALDDGQQALRDAGFSRIDYFALVDSANLEPSESAGAGQRLIAAAVIGQTRLIDNLAI